MEVTSVSSEVSSTHLRLCSPVDPAPVLGCAVLIRNSTCEADWTLEPRHDPRRAVMHANALARANSWLGVCFCCACSRLLLPPRRVCAVTATWFSGEEADSAAGDLGLPLRFSCYSHFSGGVSLAASLAQLA